MNCDNCRWFNKNGFAPGFGDCMLHREVHSSNHEACEHYEECESQLERRLKHLLQSEFIRSFDEVDIYTKEYKRDIREADYKNTGGRGTWEVQYFDNKPKFFICSNCKSRLSYRYNFCPCCGSDNRV